MSLLTETADALTTAIKAAVPALSENTTRTYRPRWKREDLPDTSVYVGVAPQRMERERSDRRFIQKRPRIAVVVAAKTPEQASESSLDVFENLTDQVVSVIEPDDEQPLVLSGGYCELDSVEVIGLDRTRFSKDDTVYAGVFLVAFEVTYLHFPNA